MGYVLGDFAKDDRDWLVTLLDAVADSAVLLAQQKPADFMSRVALLTQEKT
jgi:peptidyl-tRNA hydrolase, PTH1 family